MKKLTGKILPPDESSLIEALFDEKGWPKDEEDSKSLFNRFVSRYLSLKSETEKRVYLELAQSYEYVAIQDYNDLLMEVLDMVFRKDKKEYVIVMPLSNQKDMKKIKSGTFVSYLFNGVSLQYSKNLHKKNFNVIGDHEVLKRYNKKQISNKILILAEDYIGSGNQSIRALKSIEKYISDNCDYSMRDFKRVCILTLYINSKGLAALNEFLQNEVNVELFYSKATDKIASEYSDILDKIGISDNDIDGHLGYENCADLITLVRTPNNTIPLFRKEKSAPFPRKGQ